MQKIISAWHQEREHFQKRYAEHFKKVQSSPNDMRAVGHLNECSYTLIHIFGLTPSQVSELERFEACGLTDKDLDRNRR